MKNIRVCTRCVYDETIPAIHFDDDGVCNYCHMHDDLDRRYPNGEAGASILETMAGRIRRAGRGRKYDCVVGVSGGCDSSFTLHKAVELGLRPLAVHFDNTWDSPVSSQNIYNVTKALGVDLHTYVADNKEYDDIYMSFMRSGLRDIEAPTDIAIITTLYLACERFGIKYIIEGSSFRTEGISPLGWLYMDGKFIESVHKRFGKLPMKTYPNLTLSRFLK
ncbi:MAG: LPS biosynthesis protein, partial [Magnetospirillum sp.]